MKKILLSVAVAAVASLSISCSTGVDAKIDKLNSIADEMVEAVKDGDTDELESLAEEFKTISDELEEQDLTPEQEKEVQEVALKVVGVAIGAAAQGLDIK